MCEDDFEEGEMVNALIDEVGERIDREYSEWKEGLLNAPCAICDEPLHELDAVHTKLGVSHEKCAEAVEAAGRFGCIDNGDSTWPR